MVEIEAEETTASLSSVGAGGPIYSVPLTDRESFLLEYRASTDNHYDRNIPADGLLIWHVEGRRRTEEDLRSVIVDLETADGLWEDSGFPVGTTPNPESGEDNLDFWAHDRAYSTAHAGNHGDASDVFDGKTLSTCIIVNSAQWEFA